MSFPSELRYTSEHEWAKKEADGTVRVGITAFALDKLKDVTLVDLPAVGASVKAGARFGDIESVKTVSELFAPISGEIVAVNDVLADSPETVNDDPYAAGWMVTIRPSNAAEFEALMTAAQYETFVADAH